MLQRSLVIVNTCGKNIVRVTPHAPPLVGEAEVWPERTDVLCWYCCHAFDTRPVPMPLAYDSLRKTFKVTGNFCCFGCVKAYNRDYRNVYSAGGVDACVITLFHRECTGTLKPITASPPRVMLKAFGGDMHIDAFRKAAAEGVISWAPLPPKMMPLEQVIEERRAGESHRRATAPRQDMTATVNLTGTSGSKTNETLKLRRPKPVKSSLNMLERTLGLLNTKLE